MCAQWGPQDQKKRQIDRQNHEPETFKGRLDYQKPTYSRRRKFYSAPGMDSWNNAPPGAAEKNKRLREQKLSKEEIIN